MKPNAPCPECGSNRLYERHECGGASATSSMTEWDCRNYLDCGYCGHGWLDPQRNEAADLAEPWTPTPNLRALADRIKALRAGA